MIDFCNLNCVTDNSIYLHVEDMDDIQIISNKVLTSDELSKGIYAPRKRNVDCVADNDSVAQTTTKRACEFHDSGNISQVYMLPIIYS